MKGKLALTTGMLLYRIVCAGLNNVVEDSAKTHVYGKLYDRRKVFEWVPLLQNISGITGAHTLYESHMHNSERMTLAFIKTAAHNGAVVANHVEVFDYTKKGSRITGVLARDKFSGEEFTISAKFTVNAAGPFLPSINSKVKGLNLHKNTTGFSKGVHLVTRQITDTFALALSSNKKTEGLVTRGGRHIFIIPWRNHSLIGTTNVPHDDDPAKTRVTKRDISDFIADINALLPGVALKKEDVLYAFAGLYPLISDDIETDTYQGTGEYQVVDHAEQNNIEGIISVLGAKYTTARAIAEKAIDIIAQKSGHTSTGCQTSIEPLLEGNIKNIKKYVKDKKKQYENLFDSTTIEHLITSHGSNVDTVISFLKTTSGFTEKVSFDRETFVGEIAYAVEHEMARTLDDVIFARTGLGTIGYPGDEVVDTTSRMMAEMLNWTEDRREREILQVKSRYIYA